MPRARSAMQEKKKNHQCRRGEVLAGSTLALKKDSSSSSISLRILLDCVIHQYVGEPTYSKDSKDSN